MKPRKYYSQKRSEVFSLRLYKANQFLYIFAISGD